jgi:hypothetical protein
MKRKGIEVDPFIGVVPFRSGARESIRMDYYSGLLPSATVFVDAAVRLILDSMPSQLPDHVARYNFLALGMQLFLDAMLQNGHVFRVIERTRPSTPFYLATLVRGFLDRNEPSALLRFYMHPEHVDALLARQTPIEHARIAALGGRPYCAVHPDRVREARLAKRKGRKQGKGKDGGGGGGSGRK